MNLPPWTDPALLVTFGLLVVAFGVAALVKLWNEPPARVNGKVISSLPGTLLVVTLVVTGGGALVWRGVAELLGQ